MQSNDEKDVRVDDIGAIAGATAGVGSRPKAAAAQPPADELEDEEGEEEEGEAETDVFEYLIAYQNGTVRPVWTDENPDEVHQRWASKLGERGVKVMRFPPGKDQELTEIKPRKDEKTGEEKTVEIVYPVVLLRADLILDIALREEEHVLTPEEIAELEEDDGDDGNDGDTQPPAPPKAPSSGGRKLPAGFTA